MLFRNAQCDTTRCPRCHPQRSWMAGQSTRETRIHVLQKSGSTGKPTGPVPSSADFSLHPWAGTHPRANRHPRARTQLILTQPHKGFGRRCMIAAVIPHTAAQPSSHAERITHACVSLKMWIAHPHARGASAPDFSFCFWRTEREEGKKKENVGRFSPLSRRCSDRWAVLQPSQAATRAGGCAPLPASLFVLLW